MYLMKHIAFAFLCLQVALCLISAKRNSAEATLCEPLSRFKIDCNTCYCSVDGRGYTCTKRFCTSDVSLNYNEFMKDESMAYDEKNEDYNELLNDLAVNDEKNENDQIRYPLETEYNENNIDYGDYLNDDTEYIGTMKRGWRY